MTSPLVLLDSDTLSEIMKGHDPKVVARAEEYVQQHSVLQFSIITRFEVLRGLRAKDATRQIATFLERCRASVVYPLTEEVVDRAAEIYGSLWKRGQLISDGDILIAATALLHDLVLVTGNVAHFQRVDDLRFLNWRTG